MSFILQPWQLLFIILAALVNRRQQQVNEFQRVQIEVLLEKLVRNEFCLTTTSADGWQLRVRRLDERLWPN